ncbi:SARP family transcriptional regulator [Streptomyces rubiginosohelvolus]|nr:SARP family transcriptional regulator [Streptomyces rubiginosohelvolus]
MTNTKELAEDACPIPVTIVRMAVPALRIRLLGPLDVEIGGQAVALTGRQRGLLAALLLDVNRVVPAARCADRLWGEGAPATSAARIRALVTELRRALPVEGRRLIVTRSPGYSILLQDEELDAAEFTRLLDEASQSERHGRFPQAIDLYGKALALWRGEPFADLEGVDAGTEARRLGEARAQAIVSRAACRLACGREDEAIVDLVGFTAEQPLRERPRSQLMLALYRSGRLADALDVYEDYRTVLAEELGVEPSDELRSLRRSMVGGHRSPAAGANAPGPAGPPHPQVPRQLPAHTSRFTGRREELRRLDGMCADEGRTVLVVGAAGVGKTTLILHWADRAAARFPDGQLYLDMRGFDRSEPMPVTEALPILLQGLGWPARDIPVDQAAQIALYRSMLSSRRTLLVFDNVADVRQVRDLLPGGSHCLSVVTSRDRMQGLVALEGARRLTLCVLDREDALALLRQGLGGDMVRREPEAAAELVELCDRLPLALSIATAWIADQEHRTIGQYIARLIRQGRLAQLKVEGDEQAAVRAALDLSYKALSAEARRAFRLLGLVPHAGVCVTAAAAQIDSDPDTTDDLLSAIARVHLMRESGSQRFSWHDLVREHAAERTAAEDPSGERVAAVRRLLDHYFHTIVHLADICGYQPPSIPYEVSTALNAAPSTFDGPEDGLAWFDAEWQNILLAIAHAAEHGPPGYAPLMVDALQDLFQHHRPYTEWLRASTVALAAAQRQSDLVGQAAMHLSQGLVLCRMADLKASLAQNESGLRLARQAGWRAGEATALQGCGVALKQLGDAEQALLMYRQAGEINRELGLLRGEARCLNNQASAYLTLARLDRAEECLLANLPLTRSAGDLHLRMLTLVNLGLVHQQQARFPQAVRVLTEALEEARTHGLLYAQAVTHETLGWVHNDAGRHTTAVVAFEEALGIAERVENQTCQVDSLTGLASAELRLGRTDAALEHLREATCIGEGSEVSLVGVRMGLARIHLRLGRFDDARLEAQRSLEEARTGSRLDLSRLHGLLGAIHLAAKDRDACLRSCDEALEHARTSGQRLELARTLTTLGRAHAVGGDQRAARAEWQRAHTVFAELEVPEAAETLRLLG